MLISISLILLSGLALGELCKKIKLPSLFGMIIAGIIIGPSVLNLLDDSILSISSDIRRIALIIILIRAGLKLNIDDLKRVGRPAVMMCFVPACFEILGMVLLAPKLLGLSVLDSAILGAVVGAVSPAVVVPRMIKLIDEKRGKDKSIPQMILAGASVDDVFVIVMFTTFTGMAKGEKASVMSFVNIPISIVIGISVGILAGIVLQILFSKTKASVPVQAVVTLAVSLALITPRTQYRSFHLPLSLQLCRSVLRLKRKMKIWQNHFQACLISCGFLRKFSFSFWSAQALRLTALRVPA